MKCRHCKKLLEHIFVDLGTAPPSNAYLNKEMLCQPEVYYPLRVLVCDRCWLVQTVDYVAAHQLFCSDYAYFSSTSSSWCKHAQDYVRDIIQYLELTRKSFVIEIACNDGYLLRNFVESQIPCLGIEPTKSTAVAAEKLGITILREFFGKNIAKRLVADGKTADLIVANNVLAHVPDINDFLEGIAVALKPDGIATFEFPHLVELVEKCQFDTIYHEHYSYLSLTSVVEMFQKNGLQVFRVEKCQTHGGSLRVYAQRSYLGKRLCEESVCELLNLEGERGLSSIDYYKSFQTRVEMVKNNLLRFLMEAKQAKKMVVAYGAAAKGNTFLNYAGIRQDLLPYVVDRNVEKVGKVMPGSRIPIKSIDQIAEDRPDYLLILPWNLKKEISSQMRIVSNWGGRFVVAVPQLEVF